VLKCITVAAAIIRAAASYMMQHLKPGRYLGVCYFDSSEKVWMVLEARGRCQPRHSSPVADSQAFVIYDNARCRGADLQLHPRAVGLLTLGPATCKDQMMQAAGRLRQVGRGQSLHLAGEWKGVIIRRCMIVSYGHLTTAKNIMPANWQEHLAM
jgi:hypothetical protein